ncbi:MAG TPA: hypothetical protein VF635_11630 [Propionibacteriaceae bacterium]|jgi:hypothetical protein
MSIVTCDITMSLDGYLAGPGQSPEDPLGQGGARLHVTYVHYRPTVV